MTDPVEQQLDSFDPGARREALSALWRHVEQGQRVLPQPGSDVNVHTHTFFSYNAYGYSPSRFAWLARQAGLAVAGVVDFDVLDALEEFLEAGRLIGLKTCVSLESRVFVPEFATRVINSPGEPGIAYHMGAGFTRAIMHPFLAQMRAAAAQRTRDLLARVNCLHAAARAGLRAGCAAADAQGQRHRTSPLRSLRAQSRGTVSRPPAAPPSGKRNSATPRPPGRSCRTSFAPKP